MKRLLLLLILFTTPAFAQHSVTLTWTPSPSANVTGYNVYKQTGPCVVTGAFTKVTSTPITAFTYVDASLASGATFCYTVTAVNASSESPVGQGGYVQATTPSSIASNVLLPPGLPAAQVN